MIPPTSIPKSKTREEWSPWRVLFPGKLDMNWPSDDRIAFGLTVLEAGAYMLESHGPWNCASSGPVQVVFLQHDDAELSAKKADKRYSAAPISRLLLNWKTTGMSLKEQGSLLTAR